MVNFFFKEKKIIFIFNSIIFFWMPEYIMKNGSWKRKWKKKLILKIVKFLKLNLKRKIEEEEEKIINFTLIQNSKNINKL